MYLTYYIMGIILLPGIIFALYAQSKINSTYQKHNKTLSSSGTTAAELIKRLASSSGVNVSVKSIGGTLTDHYNPKTQEIGLSRNVYASSSLSALGIACHEFGHALQREHNYLPYVIRKTLVPITNFASMLLWPLIIIGLVFNFGAEAGGITGDIFLWSGVAVFGLAVLFSLVTLPVEYDASNRAIKVLRTTGTMTEIELSKTKEVLNAAALTYVASLVVAILNLLRFLAVVFMGRNR